MRHYRFRNRCLLVLLIFAVSCSINKTDIGEGTGDGNGSVSGGVVSIASLKAMYINRPVTITNEISIRGRVISSDGWGNFYKTLYLEDSSGGIAVRIDLEDYFKTFRYGEEVTVYCNTLTLGNYGGAIQLGLLSADGTNTVTYIPSGYILSAFRITGEAQEPAAKVVTIGGILPAHIGTYVELRDVQFADAADGLEWCEEYESYTNRYLTDRSGNTLPVRTSAYASFAREMLPSGSGIIRGVLGYFNNSYQLTVINQHYAIMESERF